jgi:hypothetical protein
VFEKLFGLITAKGVTFAAIFEPFRHAATPNPTGGAVTKSNFRFATQALNIRRLNIWAENLAPFGG